MSTSHTKANPFRWTYKGPTSMTKEGKVKKCWWTLEKFKARGRETGKTKTTEQTAWRRRLFVGSRVEQSSQGISARRATEACRSSVLRVCVRSCNWIPCLRLVRLSRVILGHGNSKIKPFNRILSEPDIIVMSGETWKVDIVLSRTKGTAIKQRSFFFCAEG